ncbi:ABC transporter ATP-binding protein [Cohnella sp. LGH]|uniref:metal ABC transporter ATP-binding protein n=1 Tax=Cohnella sp. LGH TaxID=1619153 RepID=UPI001ADB2FE0|nr:ABC transporter ATP-binding protein [Cohnella sp. LGH]QTH45485.1 ABC transporter ATP-binding protein [Cohnella sp. LGH]
MTAISEKHALAIELGGYSGGYGEETVLREISFQAKLGEAVCVVGENGAGKTTFFRALLQLLPWQSGDVAICGRQIRSSRDKRWARSQIGYVPQMQEIGKLPISVEDAVLLGRWGVSFGFWRRPGKEDRVQAEEALERVGLSELRLTDCRRLSGGQRQRLNIARAMARTPSILLLDEPTTYLDEDSKTMLAAWLDDVRLTKGVTVVTITHLKEEALQMSDRIVLLRDGKLVNEEKEGDA